MEAEEEGERAGRVVSESEKRKKGVVRLLLTLQGVICKKAIVL